jgi:hypothetical protein
MKKILVAIAIIFGLLVCKSYAGDQPWQSYANTMPGPVVLSSASTTSSELAYVTITSTGTTAATVYVISGGSTITYCTAPAAAGQFVFDMGNTPVQCKDGIQFRSSRALDATCFVSVIYRLNPKR